VRSALGPTVVWQPHAGGHGRKTWDGKDKSVSDKQFRGNVRRVDGHEGQRATRHPLKPPHRMVKGSCRREARRWERPGAVGLPRDLETPVRPVTHALDAAQERSPSVLPFDVAVGKPPASTLDRL
jgi:hypothetical protein